MKTVKKRSQLQEKSVAKSFNAKQVVASGALWGAKGDVRNDKYLFECKTTEKDYYTITSKVWEKIEEEALKDRMRTPLLIVDLRDTDRYVVFNPNHFIRQVESLNDKFPHVHGGFKSYLFRGYKEDLPIVFSIMSIKNPKKHHVLMIMKVKDFVEYFKEELS